MTIYMTCIIFIYESKCQLPSLIGKISKTNHA